MSATVVRAAARVVTARRVYEPGWVETSGETVIAVGAGRHERVDVDYGHATIVPGFVDIHVHGGGGGSYTDANTASILQARETHLRQGTTTTMASLVTLSPERLLASVRLLADMVESGVVRGIHLEGPWLSKDRCGAHDTAWLRSPAPGEVEAVLAAGRGHIRMVTIAPELPGALDAIGAITAAGAVAAVGHTDADIETTRAAIRAGARVGTHLFNAMPPLHHREPGAVAALLEDPRVTVELIADGVHVHPSLLDHVRSAVGDERVAYVTDAMSAAVLGDGDFELGTVRVEVRDSVARVAGGGSIAGSTATMDALFRRALRGAAPAGGADDEHVVDHGAWMSAVQQTSTTPAAAVGWDDVGDLAVGRRSDLVVLDEDLRVVEVVSAGRAAAGAV
ncbi:N-acetylglucosamine-6-phosphate deacetylase [Zhihengliuella halotolerans]|uniref:N-acetylglucosamine 6-phosphate deacetylase n=1 Tax=Zhihengliuella halotolerans TaxID=370736 RepID=A0A4Q8AEU8_9MICC|nr:N-acetylglucosamine-6-phosphate deacetylase [Zhihengliuella halotolerans]RZU62812.1 N-acetylglucosamine 6-phosphate deacetylase [Zhihengliuella halotolerans]